MAHIEHAVHTASSPTRQLLAFSRQQVIAPTLLNANGVIRELSTMLRRLIGEDIDIRMQLDESLGGLRGDRGQIGQVMLNLCLNARDAMPRGEP